MRLQLFCTAAVAATMLLAVGVAAQPAPQGQDCTGKPGPQTDWNQRIKACTALIEAAQSSPQDRAKAYKSRASAYFRLGNDERALADNDAAIRLDPNFADAYRGRGDIYFDLEDPDRAIAEYDQALRHNAKLVSAYTGRSAAYAQKGDLDHAMADADEAVRLDPKSADAYEQRGELYRHKGDIARALADFDAAIGADPQEAANAYNGKGMAYMAQGEFGRATAAFSAAIQADPQFMAYYNRGRANQFAGALPKAIDDYKRTLTIAPGYPYAAIWLDIAEARSKVPSTLPQTVAKLDMKVWPAPVVRMFLGEMTPTAVLAAADDPNAAKKAAHLCEANFYSGEWALRQGNKDEATRLFRVAARDCPKNFVEADAAALELKGLGATP